jgi:hypothetical protein
MKLPVLSEGQSQRNYAQEAGRLSGTQDSVEAQRWIPTGRCIPNCVCVGPDECPCCIPGDIGWPGIIRSFQSHLI